MKIENGEYVLSAHDLVGHLNCTYLTYLDERVSQGALARPEHWDPLLDILRERGLQHEQGFNTHLVDAGYDVAFVEGVDITDESVDATLEAMRAGRSVIAQAALRRGQWVGRADFLRRVETPSQLGAWSYEIIDTKLARETKGGTILQLSLYADLLAGLQGVAPEYIYVVAPFSDYVPQRFRVADYAAFFRKARDAAWAAIQQGIDDAEYPEPKRHCDVCRWEAQCNTKRRADDHLSLVANISKTQITELRGRGVTTTAALAELPLPLDWKPERGSAASFTRVREQARIQVEGRAGNNLAFEFLEPISTSGLSLLPEPSDGDVFFDIEGNAFIGSGGLEYLFGYSYRNVDGAIEHQSLWALDRATEKENFESFVDFITARQAEFPGMHVYHYAPYEPAALKRLMGRYATRGTEVDNLLRGKIFVDLYGVVRNSIRASVESYSIKRLEPFYGYDRELPLREANLALSVLHAELELGDHPAPTVATTDAVARYNRDDCLSTLALRNWLETLRTMAAENGAQISRPQPGQDGPSENVAEQDERIAQLILRLTADVPVDIEERNPEQHARWILAHTLEWHRREDKAVWWEFFRLSDLGAEDLLDEKAGLSGLELVATLETTARGIPTDRYRFAVQDTDIRDEADLCAMGGDKFGKVVGISQEDRTVDIKKTGASADIHPEAVFSHTFIDSKEQKASLLRLGEYVAEHGIDGDAAYSAARDLLLRVPPRIGDQTLHNEGESTLEAALRITPLFTSGVLPIQGPPGTGKSFTGAQMICELVRQGKKVGITANSHKVIRNLIDKVLEIAAEQELVVAAGQKLSSKEDGGPVEIFLDNGKTVSALISGAINVLGATSFFWAREDAANTVDVLFVDEAAQMSLANVLSVSQAAPALIMLGDPQQLDQPTQGTHPDGTGVSALEHILAGHQTISPEQGLFLEKTWRLHPDVTAFNSELFYEGKLSSHDTCANQDFASNSKFTGTGLRYVSVDHTGNQSSSVEEAEAVSSIVNELLSSSATWTDRQGVQHALSIEDVIIIAPYNAQVFEIKQRLPNARVGTVDKFQGQEAPIAIYSLATSSHADAPRGMEFLYSANRLNVAISRAKCMAILVASPKVFEAECRTPRQMQLANGFCRFLELADTVSLTPYEPEIQAA